MNRKEISNVKSLHPWRKTNSLFFKEEILTLLKRGNVYFAPTELEQILDDIQINHYNIIYVQNWGYKIKKQTSSVNCA